MDQWIWFLNGKIFGFLGIKNWKIHQKKKNLESQVAIYGGIWKEKHPDHKVSSVVFHVKNLFGLMMSIISQILKTQTGEVWGLSTKDLV